MSELKNYRLISGHIGYELSFYLNNPFTITVLRHPVDRLCSLYEFLNEVFDRHPDHQDADPDVNELNQLWKVVVRRPLPEFLDSPEGPVRAVLLNNPQARQLAQATPYVLTDLSDQQLFMLAEPRLKKIDVVGVTESFEETVAVTCRKMGWEIPGDFSLYRQNITEKRSVRDSLDESLRKKIERLSAVDMELYHMARKRLSDDFKQLMS